MLTVGSLFSGIGGLDLGLERAGMRVLWQCESDPYCRAVLRKHWPNIPCYEDVKALAHPVSLRFRRQAGVIPAASGTAEGSEEEWEWVRFDSRASGPTRPDVLAGGFPCQPVSLAGARRGAADERWLWPEFARLIRLLRPRYALMENVPGLLIGGGMAEVLGDLAACGYDAEWDCVAAAAVGAPHLRYRVFIVAVANESAIWDDVKRLSGQGSSWRKEGIARHNGQEWEPQRVAVAHPSGSGLEERPSLGGHLESEQSAALRSREALADPEDPDGWWPSGEIYSGRRYSQARGRSIRGARPEHWLIEPDVGRVAHGVPSRVDRLRALGNAVVPQVAEVIGRMIVAHAVALDPKPAVTGIASEGQVLAKGREADSETSRPPRKKRLNQPSVSHFE